jgi:hypothetical protein
MRRLLIPVAAVMFVGICGASLTQCRKAPAPEPAADYELVGTIKDIMEHVVDPTSDTLFDAVATDITAAGVNEKRPQTDEEWLHVENAALMLSEAANLLKMPGRRVAPAGESTKSEGPDAPELSAEEIQAKIDADRAKWIGFANKLQEQGKRQLEAARKKDAEALFALGEDLDLACEDCHLEYWYPNDKAQRALVEQQRADRAREEAQKAK